MNVKSLRLGFIVAPPWANQCAVQSRLQRSANCVIPGFDAEAVGFILAKAKIPFDIVTVFGEEVNWYDVMDAVENGTFDSIAGLWSATQERYVKFSVSDPVEPYNDPTKIYAVWTRNSTDKQNDLVMKHTAVLQVFTPETWIMFLLVFALFRFYLMMERRFRWPRHRVTNTPRAIPVVIGSYYFKSFNYCTGISLLLIGLLQNLYKTGLLRKVLLPPREKPCTNNYTLINERITITRDVFIEHIEMITNMPKPCDITIQPLQLHTPSAKKAFLFNKRFEGSDTMKRLNKAIAESVQLYFGAYTRFLNGRRYLETRSEQKCSDDDDGDQLTALSNLDVFGIYVGYCFGIAFAIAVIIIEIIYLKVWQ